MRRPGILLFALLLAVLPGCCAGFIPLPPLCAKETHGVVVDRATGRPVAGARITLEATSFHILRQELPVHRTTRTDEEGRFRFHHPGAHGFHLFVVADGYRAGRVERGAISTRVELDPMDSAGMTPPARR